MWGIIQNLIPALTGLGGVLLGNWLASKRSRKERLIDLRRQCYGAILSDVWEIERLCDVADEYISQVGADDYFNSAADKKHDDQVYQYWQTIRKRFTDDYLIISDEFRVLYEAMNSDAGNDPEDFLAPEEKHEHFESVIRKHRPLLLAQARKETAT